MTPRAEALLYAAARAQLVRGALSPAARTRARACCSIATSTPRWPIRGRRGLGLGQVREINRFATADLQPRRTLLLRICRPRVGRAQAERDESPDRLESESGEFFSRVAAAYDELAEAERERIRVLDAGRAARARARRRAGGDRRSLGRQAERRVSMRATMPRRASPPHRCHAASALSAARSPRRWPCGAGLGGAMGRAVGGRSCRQSCGTPMFPAPASTNLQARARQVTSCSATPATPGATTPTTTYAPSAGATAPGTTLRGADHERADGDHAAPTTTTLAQTAPAPAAQAAKSKTSNGGGRCRPLRS